MDFKLDNNSQREVIGLIPAAGKASRLPSLPCSKELYPIGYDSRNFSPKVVSQYLLESMRIADIKRAYFILRKGKWDIPAYFGDGKMLDMHLAYLLMDLPYGVPYTLDQAYPFVKEAKVALGFPDSIFEPEDAFVRLVEKQKESNADIVLGLFPAQQPHKTDMVEMDEDGLIRLIHIKPDRTQHVYAWEIAVWSPAFTHFMHDYVSSRKQINNTGEQNELYVSDVIQAAIQNNMRVDSVLFNEGTCLDIGTPEDLLKAVEKTNKVFKEFP